jgi:type I restriction enzyme S subunit
MKSYPKMKDSGIEWIGEIPGHWESKRLKFSTNLMTKKSNIETNSIPYLGLENIESNTATLIDVNNEMEESDAKLFQKNNVLFGKLRPYLAKVWLASFDGRCSNEFLILEGRNYEPNFLKSLLISDGCIKTIDSSTYGAKMPRAEWSFIGNMLFPLPKQDEQKQISDYLDSQTKLIDSQIESNQKLVTLLQEKRQATINHAVTKGLDPNVPMKDSGIEWIGEIPGHWEIRPISKSTNKITNGFVGPTRDILVKYGIRYLQSTYIKNGQILFNEKYFVTKEWNSKHSKSILQENDVLLVQTGANVGQCAAVTKEFEGCNCHALIIIQLIEKLGNGFYLSYLLRSNYGINYLHSIETGALHPHLEIGYVKEMPILFPKIDEQRQIVNFLDKKTIEIDELIDMTNCQIEKLQEFRQSLISAAVTGKIDVRKEVIS